MSWTTQKLGDVVDKGSSNISINKIQDDDGEYPVFAAKGFVKNVSFYHQDKDYLAIIKDGAGVGRVARHPKYSSVVATMQYLVPKQGCDIGFIEYFLKYMDFSQYINGSTIPHIYFKDYKYEPFPVVPLEEQKRIVATLDQVFSDIDKARATAERNLKNARELFDSYLQQVFSQRGEGWVETKLGDLLDIGSSKRIYETDWTNSGVPFFGGKEIVKLAKYGTVVSNAYISEEKYMDYASKYDMPQKGDILMTARGTIGVGYIVKEGDKFYYKDGNIISLRQKTPTNPQFILYAFKSKQILDQIEGLTGTTVSHLPLKKAKEIVLNIPNYNAQNGIVLKIKKMETNIEHFVHIYEKKLLAIEELKKSILQKAFTGELSKIKGIAA
jgi:type I restriction enzyme S subunit